MKLNQEENEIEEKLNVFEKIKGNINKTTIQPSRLYSSFKHRPNTSMKMKKSWKLNKLSNNDKTFFFDYHNYGYTFQTSKYFKKNLYLNKNCIVWGKNKRKKQTKFFEKEDLFDRVMKLQNTINKLNNKNNEQKIEINKQKNQLKKQNKILNEVNTKLFFDEILKDNEDENSVPDNGQSTKDEAKPIAPLSKRRSYSTEEMLTKNNNNFSSSNKLIDNLSANNLKFLYKRALKQNEQQEAEILRLNQKIKAMKISNETLISNMKLKYKQLQEENNNNMHEICELKKSSKCTKYNELMKEKDIYEKEMINVKQKLYKTLRILEQYKQCYEKNKLLIEEVNKKNIKIKKLENEIILFSKNSEIINEKLKKSINKKNKKIQKLENEIKKLNCFYNNNNNQNELKKSNKNTIQFNSKIRKLHFSNQFNSNNIKNNTLEKTNNNNNNNYNNDINNNKLKKNNNNDINENIHENNNDQNIIKDNKTNDDDEEIANEKRDIYVNHCLNFNRKNNRNDKGELKKESHSEQLNRGNLFSASWKNMHLRKEKIINFEKSNILKNSRIQEIIILYPELYQLYIEMKKRNINNNKIYLNEILLKLKEENSIDENKNIYYNSIITLFNIEEENSKKIIEGLSNKEFGGNKTLQEIKINQIKLFNELFNQKREEKNEESLKKKLMNINMKEFINIINKYDSCESGYVFFNQMILIIKELKLDEYIEDLLLLTKESDIFDLMNYNTILNMINQNNLKIEENTQDDVGNSGNEEREEKEEKEDENEEENEEQEVKNEKNKDNEEDKKDNEEKNIKKENNETSSLKNIEKEKNTEEKDDVDTKILKNLAHIIMIEGSTPSVYINSLKELIKIGEGNKSIEVINVDNFCIFLENKNIHMKEEEKKEIIQKYGIEGDNNNLYLDYDKIVETVFDFMKNDDENSHDEDFMKNIKSMDIEGMD